KPVFDPPNVTYRGPQTTLDRLRASGRLGPGGSEIYANLIDLPSLKTPGLHPVDNVPLMLPALDAADADATFTPTSVSARFTVKQVEERFVYQNMTIFVTTP